MICEEIPPGMVPAVYPAGAGRLPKTEDKVSMKYVVERALIDKVDQLNDMLSALTVLVHQAQIKVNTTLAEVLDHSRDQRRVVVEYLNSRRESRCSCCPGPGQGAALGVELDYPAGPAVAPAA